MEQHPHSQHPIAEVLAEAQAAASPLLGMLWATNSDEQKQLFLSGATENPHLEFDTLMVTDFETVDVRLAQLGDELAVHTDIDDHFRTTYSDFITQRRQQAQLLGALQTFHASPEGSLLREKATVEYQRLNESLYGQVDQSTFHALLSTKLRSFQLEPSDELAQRLLGEVKAMVPTQARAELPPPYEVSAETFTAVKTMSNILYGDLLSHIMDRDEPYNSGEIVDILTKIVHDEFGDSADGWIIRQNKQKGLSVEPTNSEVRVSSTITADGPKLRWLVGHELGVHMLRAIRGAETGLLPFAVGMAGYDAAEEGLGSVVQQAIVGTFEMAGAGHYITAGLLYENRDFRQTFEVNRRLLALGSLKPGEILTDEAINEARETAYTKTMRLARGGGHTPFLRDLSYYNGAKSMWGYFEKYGADELMLNLALLGKSDPTRHAHLQIALETRTI
jgi:hypothetical protein